jgi:hypothetical protein
MAPERQPGAKSHDEQRQHHDQPEPRFVFSQRNAADIHAEQAGDDRHRQRKDRDDGQHEERAIGLLVDEGDQFLLKQADPLNQRHRVGDRC